MKADECHDESFGCENSVFSEAQDQTFEHFVADGQSRFPQDGSQIVTTRLATVGSVVLAKGHLEKTNKQFQPIIGEKMIPVRLARLRFGFKCCYVPAKSVGCARGRGRQSD